LAVEIGSEATRQKSDGRKKDCAGRYGLRTPAANPDLTRVLPVCFNPGPPRAAYEQALRATLPGS
jgi:hypothetical protein